MFKHLLIIALRNIRKYWKYSLLNIGGLSIGLASAIGIFLYIDDELKYDRFNEKADRIYRVNRLYNTNSVNEDAATLEFPGGPALQMDYPDLVEGVVRFFNLQRSEVFFDYVKDSTDIRRFNETRFFFVDSTVFDIFTFPLVTGNPQFALSKPNTIVISESTAKRYFGEESPLGKMLRLEERLDFEVTGVMKDLPSQSHFKIDMLASMSTYRQLVGGQLPKTWIWNPCWTYILLKPNVKASSLESNLHQFYKNHYDDMKDQDVKLYLQALTDIHLNSHHVYEMHPNSNSVYIYILTLIGIIILILASINFVNLSTASSAGRAKEISMKKIFGGQRRQIAIQFLGETILQTICAIILALLVVEVLRASFNNFTGKDISSDFLFDPHTILISIALAIFVGFVAGTYPAFVLSSFQPLAILRGKLKAGARAALARKILVVLQFAISVSLIIGTLVAFAQLNFLRNAELGFNKDQIITFESNPQLFRNYNAFREELLKNKDILYVTGSEDVLGVNHNTRAYQIEGLTEGQNNYIPTFMVDWDFVETFGIEVVEGRAFSRKFPSDTVNGVMINETMVRDLGWTNEKAIGKRVRSQDGDERVIGVFRDFNAMSLHRPVSKFILDMFRQPQLFNRVIAIRVKTDNYKELIRFIEDTWTRFAPTRPFEYDFLDKKLDALYNDEERFGKFTLLLTFLAIIIASLGLIGLTAFLTEQRTREIGIRRVMGASTFTIMNLMFSEFILLISASFVISWPLTWYVSQKWLDNYSRHVMQGPGLYLVSWIITLTLAFIIISYRAIKASSRNPAYTLRYE
ncbi:MAG: ABC transporter permease [Bacteroidales bacterium]